jgi:hypothetical protein
LQALITISKASPNPFLTKKIEDLKQYIKDKDLEDIKNCPHENTGYYYIVKSILENFNDYCIF